jgi:hypothetical protein
VHSAQIIDAHVRVDGFAQKMIAAELAEATRKGVRVRGAKGRIEWLQKKREAGQKGGEASAESRSSKREQLPKHNSSTTQRVLEHSLASPPSKTQPSYSAPAPALVPTPALATEDQEPDRDCEGGEPLARLPAPSLTAPDGGGLSVDGRKRKPPSPRKDPLAHQIVTAATWDAYRVAYARRYGPTPTRNAKVNGQIAHFVQRVPHADAPQIAEHYVYSNNARYIAAGHAWGPLVQDAEKLRTEWLTGRDSTAHAARQADRKAGRADEYGEAIARLEAEARVST